MAGTCSSDGEGRGVYRVLVGTPEGKRPIEDAGVDVRIILKWIFRNWDRGMNRTDLAHDRDRWRGGLW
jgi:hypothetical protein